MMIDPVDTTEMAEGVTVSVYYDADQLNPRRDYDHHFGTLIGYDRDFSVFDIEWTNPDDCWDWAREIRAHIRSNHGLSLMIPVRFCENRIGWDFHECEWDRANGVLFATLEKIHEEYDNHYPRDTHIARARELLLAELSEYNHYGNGEVYGYVVSCPEDDHLGSCWGFIGDDSYAMQEGMDEATYFVEQRKKAREEDLQSGTPLFLVKGTS